MSQAWKEHDEMTGDFLISNKLPAKDIAEINYRPKTKSQREEHRPELVWKYLNINDIVSILSA